MNRDKQRLFMDKYKEKLGKRQKYFDFVATLFGIYYCDLSYPITNNEEFCRKFLNLLVFKICQEKQNSF